MFLCLLATACIREGLGICVWSPRSRSRVCTSHGLRVHEVDWSDVCSNTLQRSWSHIKLVFFVSRRALFLLSKGMVSWNPSLLIKGTLCVIILLLSHHASLWTGCASVALQLLLVERKLGEVHPLLTLCGTIVESWQGHPIQKESLRVFFLVLQVTHYLDAGQVQLCQYVSLHTASRAACWSHIV